jgi:hypothetical protein
MSHFSVLVITNQTNWCSQETFEENVNTLLEPYREHAEFPEYDIPCYCIGTVAYNDVICKSNKIFNIYSCLADELFTGHKLPESYKDMTIEERDDYQNKIWVEITKNKKEFEDTALSVHPLKDSPDPNCNECMGKGMVRSTYNPKSKWDCFTIGGRWNGSYHAGGANIFKMKELKGSTFAVVTPDGEWHEKGKMGWWGVVSDKNDGYNDAFEKFIIQYIGNYVVVVDCHI